jgi:hypothetical protein
MPTRWSKAYRLGVILVLTAQAVYGPAGDKDVRRPETYICFGVHLRSSAEPGIRGQTVAELTSFFNA